MPKRPTQIFALKTNDKSGQDQGIVPRGIPNFFVWNDDKRMKAMLILFLIAVTLVVLTQQDIIGPPGLGILTNEIARADNAKAKVEIAKRKLKGEKGPIQVSGCVQKPDNWSMPMHSKIPDAIFVSVASYREAECKDTVYDMFEKASRPQLLFVGVVQQNKEGEKAEDCFDRCQLCAEKKRSGHIRVKNFSHLEARGPTFARYECSKLWRGEEYYMQIDSHLKFEPGWDEVLRDQAKQTNDPKYAIGAYPPTEAQMKKMRQGDFKTMITMCPDKFDSYGLPTIKAQVISNKGRNKPLETGLLSAGLMFFPGEALYEVPYDPYLSYLFFGEETLHSARLWTAGYNIYAPTKAFCVHHYGRKGAPRFWSDQPNAQACKKKAIQRAKYLLGGTDKNAVHPDYFLDIDKYGMGNKRSLQAYFDHVGINMKQKKITKGCPMP